MIGRQVICSHCGHTSVNRGHGLCCACYLYQYRHGGAARPLALPTHCVVCAERLSRHSRGGICNRCYARARRRGLRAADLYAGQAGVLLRAVSA